MYFKERENSPLFQHYRKVEHARLSKKIEEIKGSKLKLSKHNNSVEHLPPITHRQSEPKLYKKQMILAETDRLNKKIHELKTKRSTYFSKVIGLNLSAVDQASSTRKPRRSDGKINKTNLAESPTTAAQGEAA
jgi:hypothetical protein